ncbi:MAG: NAD-binding protein, partial [Escherichia coli]
TMHRKDHFIVCGHSILAINTILQLNQRGQNVTVISNLPEDDIKQLEQRLGDNADVIPGDSNDSSVLKKAGIDRCRAILALSDNDADNAFVVLSAKDMSSDVKTVLAVSDSKNLNKIKMVHPDIILSPQLFGSEILARVLNGEEINNDMLVSMLLNSGHGIFSDNDEQETKAESKESAQR